ncbi:cation:proton antiporter [Pseudomonas oryzihabitans]|uniref:cation:proton antiporter n=1 Tax=Pseudomonas oryzihabitans TaxID=47885 RepID=UPI003EBBC97E
MLELAAIILFITAVLAFLNRRYVGLPSAIGVMAIALALSLGCIGLDWLGFPLVRDYEQNLLSSIDFSELLMQGMLSVLLFAGALHIDLSELRAFRWQVSLLAVVGTTVSTLVVGFALFYLLSFTHVSLSLIHCLIFGALISPTDPIAVMGILKTAGAPKNTELVIAGESLFNDGVGVVLFSVLLATLVNDEPITVTSTLEIFAHEAGGGILLGLVVGYLAFVMLRSIDSYPEEILITLATVLGGYTLANRLGVSGPLAMVVAGLIIGNHGRALAMSDTTRKRIDAFWEALDEILNAVLFVLIGLEIILIDLAPPLLLGGVMVAVLTLLARLVTVGIPVGLLGRKFRLVPGSWRILTWGGLRGGISVALALSLPIGGERDVILTLTYVVVICSILGQGLTIGKVAKTVCNPAATPSQERH